MNNAVPHHVKKRMVELYVQGKTRDEIASITGWGEGTVSDVTAEWKEKIGRSDAEATRDFALEVRKNGMTVPDCIEGARTNAITKRLGLVDERRLNDFLGGLVDHVEDKITSEEAGETLLDMVAISKEAGIPLKKLPEYARQKFDALRKIQNDTAIALQQKKDADAAKERSINETDQALKAKNLTFSMLDEYTRTEEELAKNNLTMKDRATAIRVLNNIKEQQSAENIINAVKTIDSLKERIKVLTDKANQLEPTRIELLKLQSQVQHLKVQRDSLDAEMTTRIDSGIKKMDYFNSNIDASTARLKNAADSSEAKLIASARNLADYLISLKEEFEQNFKANQDYVQKSKAIGSLEPLARAVRGEEITQLEYARALTFVLEPVYRIYPNGHYSRILAARLHNSLQEDLTKMGA